MSDNSGFDEDRVKRPTQPPPMEFLLSDLPRAGEASVGIELGPIGISIEGCDPLLAEELRTRYGPYARDLDPSRVRLRFEVVRDENEYFIDPPPRPEVNPVYVALDGDRIRFLGYRLAAFFDTGPGAGRIVLASGTYEPAVRAIENCLRASTAWQAFGLGGAFVHGASAVLRGRGFLFYGASGAGKSTLSACNRRAAVVSDDLSLVLPDEGGRLMLVGTPFRGTYTGGPPVLGSFPLAAGFRLVKAAKAEV